MGQIWNWTPSMEGKNRPKKGADQSKLVGNTGICIWRYLYVREFTCEQGNLHLRLVLYGSKVNRSLSPPTRILKGLYRTLEKAMAPHSSTLAWKIPWMEGPGRLQSMGLLRVGHDWVTSLSLFTFMHWRRKWQPTPEFLPGESQGQGSLIGCRLWGHTELDTTEVT